MKSFLRSSSGLSGPAVYLIFLIFLLGCFTPVWLGGRVLAPMDILTEMLLPWRGDITVPKVHNHFVSDAITQYIPYRWQAHESLREDGYLGWSDMNYGGTPQYANTMATAFDWTVQLHRWLPFWSAWHAGIFLQFLIAGWGMIFFLRSERLSPLAALLGGICYAGNFQFIAWIYHRWALGSFCWMPLVLWTLMPLVRASWNSFATWKTWPGRVFLLPVFLCLAFFGGTLQHAAFVMIAVACVGFSAAWKERRNPASALRCLAAFAALGLLGVGLAWMMFAPCISSFLVNQTATSRADGFGYPGGKLQPLLNLLVYPFYAFPWPLGSPDTLDMWKAFKTDLFYLPYIGFLPAAFAVAGLFSPRVSLAPKLLMVTGLVIPLTPLVAPLYHRVFLVGILGAVWSACVFVDGIRSEDFRLWSRRLAWLFAGGTLIWLAAGFAVFAFRPVLSKHLHGIIEGSVSPINFVVFADWYLSRGDVYLAMFAPWSPYSLLPWALACLGCGLLLAFGIGGKISRSSLIAGACILAAAELCILAARWVTFSPRESSPVAMSGDTRDLYPPPKIITSLRSIPGADRVYTDPSRLFSIPIPPNILSTFGIPALRGYDSIQDKIMDGIASPKADSSFLPALGVTHAVVGDPLSDPSWRLIQSADGVYLYEFLAARPRYQTTGGPSTGVNILSTSQNHHHLTIQEGRSLRVSENWHEGWRYRVNGGIWKTPARNPDMSMQLDLPGRGRSDVEMRFDPLWANRGWMISALSLALLLVAALYRRFWAGSATLNGSSRAQ